MQNMLPTVRHDVLLERCVGDRAVAIDGLILLTDTDGSNMADDTLTSSDGNAVTDDNTH